MTRHHTTPTATIIVPAQATSTQSTNVILERSPQCRVFNAGLLPDWPKARAVVMQAGLAQLVTGPARFLKRSFASQ